MIISGNEGTLYIDEMVVPRLRRTEQQGNREQDIQQRNVNREENTGNPQGTTARETMSEQVMRLRMGYERGYEQPEIQAIYAQVNSITRQCTEIKREIENLRNTHNENISRMHTTIRRINFFPTNRRLTDNDLERQTEQETLVRMNNVSCSLSKCPRTLYALWNEYEFGVNGQKAAKNFTSRERGASRFTYSRRKVFWDKVRELVRAGHTSLTAIDLISNVYRNKSVTQIINAMLKDKRRNTWPSDLRV